MDMKFNVVPQPDFPSIAIVESLQVCKSDVSKIYLNKLMLYNIRIYHKSEGRIENPSQVWPFGITRLVE